MLITSVINIANNIIRNGHFYGTSVNNAKSLQWALSKIFAFEIEVTEQMYQGKKIYSMQAPFLSETGMTVSE